MPTFSFRRIALFICLAFGTILLCGPQVLFVTSPGNTSAQAEEKSSSKTDTTSQELPLGIVKEKPAKGHSVKISEGYMVPYTVKIPNTEITFEMVPVPGGTFMMGSPEDEEDREEDEGPQFEVAVEPFWIAKCEVSWGEYHAFIESYDELTSIKTIRAFLNGDKTIEAQKKSAEKQLEKINSYPALTRYASRKVTLKSTDAITIPTPLFQADVTYARGNDDELPAVTMTYISAKQYSKWLSAVAGQEYRLPCEAEWEYAARAGSKTAFCFGDDTDELEDYGWFFDNSDDTTHPVGEKEPNAWGIYDMHGNVAEWVLDQYLADRYSKFNGKKVEALNTIAWPTKVFPCVLKGGSWGDDAEWCRSAKRIRSNIDWSDPVGKSWKDLDPQIPQSPYWYTEEWTQQVGFRIMRPLKKMTANEKRKAWDPLVKDTQEIIRSKLAGKGLLGIADKDLAEAVKELKKMEKAARRRHRRK